MVQFGSTSAGAQYGSAMNVERPTLEHLKREQELMMARRTCPLSQLPYEEPVEAADGHIYERHFIEQWIAQCQAHCRPITSPLTKGELLRSLTLKPRPDLQAEVAAAMLGLGASPSSLKFEPPFFRQLDKFLERPMVQNLNLRPPAIVPIGVESAGKSTVLERIMGLTLLPRDAQMCTRMVIRVHLRRRKEEARAAVRLVLRSRRPPFAEVANTERHVAAPNFIAQYVKEMMELAVERAGQPIVTEHELLVEVHRPDAPNLDIVDVPGLVTAEKEGLQNVPALTEQLIEDVIRTERAHGIFLIVIPATEQLNTSATMKLVQKHGIEDLSIGIRTKADLKHPANSDDTRREVIEMEILGTVKDAITGAPRVAPGFVTLQQGWLAMANLSGTRVLEQVPEYHRERYRLSLMDSAEQRLWNDLIAADMNKNMPNMENTPALEARFGRFAVRAYVQRQFERFIVEHWLPKVRDGLQCFYFDTSKGYVKLGLPVPQELTADPAAPMTSALNRVVADVTEFIHGDPESIFVDEQTYAAKPETFRAIVGSRVAIAESAADSDWTGLQTDAELWRAVHGVRVAVEAAVAESDAPAVAASTAARRVAAHKTRLDKAARDVVAKLVALGRSGPLVDRFLAALDDSPVVNQTMPVYGPLPKRKLTTRLALAKRLPALGAAMRAHLLSAAVSAVENEFLPIATDVLQRAVLAAYGSATVDEPQAADRGAGRFIVRALRPEETKVLGQDLIDAFLAAVVCALGDAAAVFDVVSASGGALLVEADDVRGERLAVLTELVDVGDALRSLKQLQASVDSTLGQAQAPPPVQERGAKVRQLMKRLLFTIC